MTQHCGWSQNEAGCGCCSDTGTQHQQGFGVVHLNPIWKPSHDHSDQCCKRTNNDCLKLVKCQIADHSLFVDARSVQCAHVWESWHSWGQCLSRLPFSPSSAGIRMKSSGHVTNTFNSAHSQGELLQAPYLKIWDLCQLLTKWQWSITQSCQDERWKCLQEYLRYHHWKHWQFHFTSWSFCRLPHKMPCITNHIPSLIQAGLKAIKHRWTPVALLPSLVAFSDIYANCKHEFYLVKVFEFPS